MAQNYSSFANPTHYEIQKRLVDNCGQDSDILGKKRWIGSQDVQARRFHIRTRRDTRGRAWLCQSLPLHATPGDALQMFLDDAIGVTSKIHSCTSGDELATLGRFLTHHFETQARRKFEILNHFL